MRLLFSVYFKPEHLNTETLQGCPYLAGDSLRLELYLVQQHTPRHGEGLLSGLYRQDPACGAGCGCVGPRRPLYATLTAGVSARQ